MTNEERIELAKGYSKVIEGLFSSEHYRLAFYKYCLEGKSQDLYDGVCFLLVRFIDDLPIMRGLRRQSDIIEYHKFSSEILSIFTLEDMKIKCLVELYSFKNKDGAMWFRSNRDRIEALKKSILKIEGR